MKVVFTKGPGKFDSMDVFRPDGTSETVQCPKQGIIPHDMVHYAVEHTLTARGFLRRVGGGESASFRMKPEAESDSVERLVEALQGDAWSGGGSSEQDILDMYQVTCSARGCPALPLSHQDVAAARSAIRMLSSQWDAIPVQGTLELRL
jgi:hypothetical protein